MISSQVLNHVCKDPFTDGTGEQMGQVTRFLGLGRGHISWGGHHQPTIVFGGPKTHSSHPSVLPSLNSQHSRAAAQRSPTHVLCCLNRVSVSPQARSARGGRPVSTELQTQTADGPASSLRCGAGLETAPFQEAAIQGVEGSPS